jgi:hypothetical protein
MEKWKKSKNGTQKQQVILLARHFYFYFQFLSPIVDSFHL